MKSPLLILMVVIIFMISSTTIAFIVQKELDPNYKKDWFTIGFITLSNDSADFILTNHSSTDTFRYTISSGGKIKIEDSFTVENGQTLSVHPDNTDFPKPYTVSVFPENDTKKSQSLTRK